MKTFTDIKELGNYCCDTIGRENDGLRVQVKAWNKNDIRCPDKQDFLFKVTGAEEYHCLEEIVEGPLMSYGYTNYEFKAMPIEHAKNCLEANALNNVEHAIRWDNMDEISNTELMLAWQQFFWMDENSGLHPDDWTGIDNGWTGWHVLLADLYFRNTECSDGFTYPCYILHFKDALEKLEGFHADDDDPDYINAIQQIRFFFNAATIDAIDDTIVAFEMLLGYHSTLAEEEEGSEPRTSVWDPLNDAYFVAKEIQEMRDAEADQMFNQLMSDVIDMCCETPDVNPAGERF